MPIWKKSREATTSRQLKEARANHARLKHELEAVEAGITQQGADAVALARSGGAPDRLREISRTIATDKQHVKTLRASLAGEQDTISALERELADLRVEAQRKQTDAQIAEIEAEVTRDTSTYVAAAQQLAKSFARAVPVVPEARGVEMFATKSVAEVPDAAALVVDLLKSHARAVREGVAPATIPEPEVTRPPEPADCVTFDGASPKAKADTIESRSEQVADSNNDGITPSIQFQQIDRGPTQTGFVKVS